MKKKKHEINMTEGSILPIFVSFAIPLMLSGILQLLFNAADMVVAGRFAGSIALAAVGSTSALINLIINVFVGLSVGCNVVVAGLFGSGRYDDVKKAVHTSVTVSLIGGIVLSFVGIFLSRPLLELMKTPSDVIGESVKYMRIYFAGMPVMMLYNFGSAVFRAMGDTRRPLIFLTCAGVINVFLNIFFVTRFGMGVAGVALATVLSQCVSSGMLLRAMFTSDGCFRLEIASLGVDGGILRNIVRIGVPAGLQSIMFSVSNVLLQSSVNSLGSLAMAGSTADSNIENFVYISMNAFNQATISFTAQNYASGKYERIRKALIVSLAMEMCVGLGVGWGVYGLGERVVRIYNTDPEVIKYALQRMSIVSTTYFTCGMQEVMGGYLRGIGKSFAPMLVSAVAICGVRILWIYTVFPLGRDLRTLFTSYPVSWVTAVIAMALVIRYYNKKTGICAIKNA